MKKMKMYAELLITLYESVFEGSWKPNDKDQLNKHNSKEKLFVTRQEIKRYFEQIDISEENSLNIENEIADYIIRTLFIDKNNPATEIAVPKIKLHCNKFKQEYFRFLEKLDENNDLNNIEPQKMEIFIIHRFIIPYLVFNYSDLLKIAATEIGKSNIEQFASDIIDRNLFRNFLERIKDIETEKEKNSYSKLSDLLGINEKTIQRYKNEADKYLPTEAAINKITRNISDDNAVKKGKNSLDIVLSERFILIWNRTFISLLKKAESNFGGNSGNEIFEHFMSLLSLTVELQKQENNSQESAFCMFGLYKEYRYLSILLLENSFEIINLMDEHTQVKYSDKKPVIISMNTSKKGN